jgi:hypothetical protein
MTGHCLGCGSLSDAITLAQGLPLCPRCSGVSTAPCAGQQQPEADC